MMRTAAYFVGGLLAVLSLGGCPLDYEDVTAPGVRVQTAAGAFTIRLLVDEAPVTVSAFLENLENGYYDRAFLHRAVAGALVEGGAFALVLEQKEAGTPIRNEAGNPLRNVRGTIALVRGADPDSGAAQFRINVSDQPATDPTEADPGFAVFGRVIRGLAVVDALAAEPTVDDGPFLSRPVQPLVLESVARVATQIEAFEAVVVRITTRLGSFDVELFAPDRPNTVANFLAYVDDGFYDGTVIHRTGADYFEAGGFDLQLTEKSTREPIANEGRRGRSNALNTIAMARTDEPDSATSQFYFNLADNTGLDPEENPPGYTVFGRVVAGAEIVARIGQLPTRTEDGLEDVPREDVTIRGVDEIMLNMGELVVAGVRIRTNLGTVLIELFPDTAPVSVENFLDYVRSGFYEHTIFHRVIADFVVQGGGFQRRALQPQAGGVTYFNEGSARAPVRGTVALLPVPGSATIGPAFRIHLADGAVRTEDTGQSLPVFGEIVDGIAVLDALAMEATETRGTESDILVRTVPLEGLQLIAVSTGERALSAQGEFQRASQEYRIQLLIRDALVQLLSVGISSF